MSMVQTLTGAGVVGLALSALVGFVLPEPPPIQVHSISLTEAGTVSQDRTVITAGPSFYATWTAAVVPVDEGPPVCEGNGSFPYKPGRINVVMSLAAWVGDERCILSALPPGEYYLRAAWHWGTSQTSQESAHFTVGGLQ